MLGSALYISYAIPSISPNDWNREVEVTLLVKSCLHLSVAVPFSSLRSYTLVVMTTSRYLSFMNCFCVWNVLFIVSLFCCRLCIGKPLTCVYYLTEITVTEIITVATLQNSPPLRWLVWLVGQQMPPSLLLSPISPSCSAASRILSGPSGRPGLTLLHSQPYSSESDAFWVDACLRGSLSMRCLIEVFGCWIVSNAFVAFTAAYVF